MAHKAGADNRQMSFDPESYLQSLANMPDEEIDVALAALALSARSHKGLSADKYINHLKQLSEGVAARHVKLLEAGAEDNAETQLAALKHILHDQEGYNGDTETYDDLQNASLCHVVNRRRGLPISLSILYIHVGQAQGWDVVGIDLPGHFVCRLEKDGVRLIFDPFQGAKILQAADLRAIIKQAKGPHAELSAEYFEPAENRDILVRLQNNIKFRQIAIEDFKGALFTVQSMKVFCDDDYRLLLESGVLLARTGQPMAAIHDLEAYITRAPNSRDREEAALLLDEIKASLQ